MIIHVIILALVVVQMHVPAVEVDAHTLVSEHVKDIVPQPVLEIAGHPILNSIYRVR